MKVLLLSLIAVVTISGCTNSHSIDINKENQTDPKLVSLCGLSDTFKEDVKSIDKNFNYSNYNTDKLLSSECINYAYSVINNFKFVERDFKFSNNSVKEFNYFTDSSNTINIISLIESKKNTH